MNLIRDIAFVLFILFVTWLAGERRGALAAMFEEHGIVVAVGILALVAVHWWIFRLYSAMVQAARKLADDRGREIGRLSDINDRLLAENSEYRNRFLRIIDDKLNLSETDDREDKG